MLRTEEACSPENTIDTPETIYLKDYREPSYSVENFELFFDLNEGRTVVQAKTDYKRQDPRAMDLTLDGEGMKLLSISMNGRKLESGKDYALSDTDLRVKATPSQFTLLIETEIVPEENTSLDGLYKSGGNYTTQCEAEGFRKITYFMDRPDVMARYTVRIEADKTLYPVLLSNGNLLEHGDLVSGDNRHYAVWHDPHVKPCYLFALVAGDLVVTEDSFTTFTEREVALKIYTRAGDEHQVAHAMQALKDSMKWDEQAYGRDYDLDLFNIVAISDFNMGAMENKSLNIFNTQLVLAHPETATDQDFLNVQRVIGHEYFHNWSGNRVTCRDWFQLSLKEGFTVFRENQFGQYMNDEMVERIDEVKLVRSAQFPEDAGPMAHPIRPESYIEINNFYTVTVYEKGGEVIRMMSLLLGAQPYREATNVYFTRHDGEAVTCEDFVQAMEDSSKKDLTQFRLWYSQAGTPLLKMHSEYNAETQDFTLHFEQSIPDTPGQTDKKPMHMPILVGLLDTDGNDIHLGDKPLSEENTKAVTTVTLELTEAKQSFTFPNVPAGAVPSVLRGFSAPVKLETDLSDDDLRFLMVNDSDGFNRWDAGQNLALRMLQNMMSKNAATDPAYITALGGAIEALKDKKPALLARVLALPEYSILAQDMRPIDPQLMQAKRDQAMKDIGTALMDQLQEAYDLALDKNDSESTHPDAMGWRSLMNIALQYITAADANQGILLASKQYESAYCMTERMGALSVMADHKGLAYDAALADFYERFSNYELVVNKWFGLQAASTHSEVISDVRNLMQHPDFTMKNPNRLRSLVAGFAMRNMVMFHDESGAGYTFLREVVQELNTLNPQIASRMLTPLRQWTDFKPALRDLMHKELLALKNTPNLSPDVFEIVTKTLAAGETERKAA